MTPPNDDALLEILEDFADGIAAEEAWVDAETALKQWKNAAVIAELECVKTMLPYLSSYDGKPHPLTQDTHTYLEQHIQELKTGGQS